MARARVTADLRYCSGSSGPSHSFCHLKGHWDQRQQTQSSLLICRSYRRKQREENQSVELVWFLDRIVIIQLKFRLRKGETLWTINVLLGSGSGGSGSWGSSGSGTSPVCITSWLSRALASIWTSGVSSWLPLMTLLRPASDWWILWGGPKWKRWTNMAVHSTVKPPSGDGHTWTKLMQLNCSRRMNEWMGESWTSAGGSTFWWIKEDPWQD